MGFFDRFRKKNKKTEASEAVTTRGGLVEARVRSGKWGDDFSLLCDTRDQLPYAEKCLAYLDDMPADMEKRLSLYLWRYYQDYEDAFLEEYGEGSGLVESEILEHVGLGSLIVGEDCRQDRIEFHVSGFCDWEPEHGLEVTVSDGKILYVGPFEDYEPNSERLLYALEHYGYYDPEAFPIMNYADKE